MGGTVESVSVTAGSEVAAGTVAAVISVSDLGYTVSFSVKNDQAKKVKVGDKAEITSWYWGDSFSATLSEVKTDTANPQTQKLSYSTLQAPISPQVRPLPFPWAARVSLIPQLFPTQR